MNTWLIEAIGWSSTVSYLISNLMPKRLHLHLLGIYTAAATGFYAYEHGATAIWVKWLIAFFVHAFMTRKVVANKTAFQPVVK